MPQGINTGEILEALNDKMDRDGHNVQSPTAFIVETYSNGTDWYRIWSDGWCEQGGKVPSQSSWKTVSLLKPYNYTNYQVIATANGNVNGTGTWTTVVDSQAYTNDSIQIKGTNASSEWFISWRTCGYIL